MLAKFRLSHPFLFAVLIYLIFFVTMNGTSIPAMLAIMAFCGGDAGAVGEQVVQIICEVVPALLFCLILWRTDRLGLLTKKGRGLVAGLKVGGYSLCFILVVLAQTLLAASVNGYEVNFTVASVVYVPAMISVGVTEEIMARGLIGETFLEHFGTARAGAIKAAVASGVIFGAMHLTNAMDGRLPETMLQVCLCVTGGILYGAIYFRGGNIWSIAIIHGLNDVVAGMAEWLFNGGAHISSSTGIELGDLVLVAIIGALDLIAAFYVLRPSKADEVRESWPEIQPTEDAEPEPAA